MRSKHCVRTSIVRRTLFLNAITSSRRTISRLVNSSICLRLTDKLERSVTSASIEAGSSRPDRWTAYREGAFGKRPRPFVGWMTLVEDREVSRNLVRDASPHFPIFPEFEGRVVPEAPRYSLPASRAGTTRHDGIRFWLATRSIGVRRVLGPVRNNQLQDFCDSACRA